MSVQPDDQFHFCLLIFQDCEVFLNNSKLSFNNTSIDKYPSVYVAGYFLVN